MDKVLYQRLVKLARSKNTPLDDPKIILENKELFNGRYGQDKTDKIKNLLSPEKKHQFNEIASGIYISWINAMGSKNIKVLSKAYDGCIKAVDQELIKVIVEKLKITGLYDKTIIVITADHGEAFGEHGIYGHGYLLYDEFIHIPLIIKAPYAKGGHRVKELAQSVDIMPTVLDLAGIVIPHQAQGKSLMRIMGHELVVPHEYIFSQAGNAKLIRSQEWKLFIGPDYGKVNCRKILFHLTPDSAERRDVYSDNQAVAERLELELNKFSCSLPAYNDKEYPFSLQVDKEAQKRIRKTGYW
jgi:arylsulfatase A-like enzyme